MTTGSLRGRDSEIASLRAALLAPECRLLTLTGPPGVGKSRLAAAVGEQVADRFADGIVAVDVLGCTSTDEVASLLGARLGLGRGVGGYGDQQVAAYLSDRTVLLVLDSCEAVAGLGAFVAGLLIHGRRLKVLATSQVRLRIAAERAEAVPPLAMPEALPGPPPATEAELQRLADVPAMAMLLACTREVRPGFALTAENAADLVALCRQLEGLPLALEVAAARLAHFAPAALARRLRDRGRLLDSELAEAGRHRSLRTAIDWSHDLLAAEEKRVFRRVAVFPGPWSLSSAAEVVDEAGLDLPACVEALVAKNLVGRLSGGQSGELFDLLDTLRQYGRERLREAGEAESVAARFRSHYAALAATAESAMGTLDETTALAWGATSVVPSSAAFRNSLEVGDIPAALWLATAVGWQWYTRGSPGERHLVVDLVTRALAARAVDPRDHATEEDALGAAALVAGVLSWAAAELEQAHTLLEAARDLAEHGGPERRAAVAHAFLGHVARTRGDHRVARREAETAHRVFAALGNDFGAAWVEHDLALVSLAQGHLPEAEVLLRRALSVFDGAGDAWAGAWARAGLAEVAVAGGRWAEAEPHLAAALEVYRANGDEPRVAHCRSLLAEVRARTIEADPLTPRQREVAARVAEGATNRQIARSLGITDKTVEVHLSQIMGRLGLQNRAQVAGYVVRSELERSD